VRTTEAGLYAASARRVLRARGLHSLGERLRVSDERLVFVVGSPRSGTTFFASALGELPGFVDLSEVNPHKAAIPALTALSEAEAALRIRTVLERVRALALVRGWRGVEQTPETAFVLAPALAAYPASRAVHLVRDGRDVACSLLERGWLSAGRTGGDDAKLAYGAGARFWVEPGRRAEFETAGDATRVAWAWRRYVSAARSVANPRVLELRYEAIAADPVTAARAVAGHLETEPEPLERSLGAFSDSSIGRYRHDLSPEQLADVEREAGTLLVELGYA
jgi:Sulfotransferase family